MARLLTKSAEWEDVSGAYAGLMMVRQLAPANAGQVVGFTEPEELVAEHVTESVKEALAVLDRHARSRRSGGNLLSPTTRRSPTS